MPQPRAQVSSQPVRCARLTKWQLTKTSQFPKHDVGRLLGLDYGIRHGFPAHPSADVDLGRGAGEVGGYPAHWPMDYFHFTSSRCPLSRFVLCPLSHSVPHFSGVRALCPVLEIPSVSTNAHTHDDIHVVMCVHAGHTTSCSRAPCMLTMWAQTPCAWCTPPAAPPRCAGVCMCVCVCECACVRAKCAECLVHPTCGPTQVSALVCAFVCACTHA